MVGWVPVRAVVRDAVPRFSLRGTGPRAPMTAYEGAAGARPLPAPPRLPRAQDAAPAVENLAVWPGQPFPLGATWDGIGTNFSLFSEVAQSVLTVSLR